MSIGARNESVLSWPLNDLPSLDFVTRPIAGIAVSIKLREVRRFSLAMADRSWAQVLGASEPLGRSASGGPERASFLAAKRCARSRATSRVLRGARWGKNLLSDGFWMNRPAHRSYAKSQGEILT